MSSPLDEGTGQIEITRFVRHSVQFDQRHFQFGVTAKTGLPVGSQEVTISLVGGSPSDLQKGVFASGRVVLDGRFDHVPQHVAVVRSVQKLRIPGRLAVVRDVRVQVSVGLLNAAEQSNHVVDLLLEFRIGKLGQGVGASLQKLVQVGLAPGAVQVAIDRFPDGMFQSSQFPAHVLPTVRNRLLTVHVQLGCPEGRSHVDVSQRQAAASDPPVVADAGLLVGNDVAWFGAAADVASSAEAGRN